MNKILITICIISSLFLSPKLSNAQDIGLKVKEMPKGLIIHYLSSSGEKRVATFLGRSGRTYDFSDAVTGRKTKNFTARQKFDGNGRKVVWIGEGSYREKWLPFHCEYAVGSCVHKRRDQYGNGRTWIYEVERKGTSVKSLRRMKNESQWRVPTTVKLGKYNIRMSEEFVRSNGTKWSRKVTKIIEP